MKRAFVLFCFLLTLSTGHAQLFTTPRVLVRQFHFEGNTAIATDELTGLVAKYVGRELTREDLEDARRAVTLAYTQRGYVNSGAILPNQPVADGIITFRIVEGRLSDIQLTGQHWLRAGYLTDRIHRFEGPPLNVTTLKDGLQWLRQNPNIEQINAELRPGSTPGESVLDVRVKDRPPFRAGLQVDNARPPSVDSVELLGLLGDRNLTGHGDNLEVTYGIAQGGDRGFRFSDLDNLSGAYTLPVNRYDTTVRLFGERKNYTVVEIPFDALGIHSQSDRYGVQLRQPVLQTANRELAVAVSFERRHSETFLLGQPFDFPASGSVSGRTEISVLRLSQEWTDRSLRQVVALRSTFNIGLDVFGTTPHSEFVGWLGQAQYVRRLGDSQCQLLLRVDGQWNDHHPVALEQFSLGGLSSVRGYRENQLVRDRGIFSSAEVHVPVLLNKYGAPVIQLAPFYDFGAGWSAKGTAADNLMSVGLGLLVTPCRNASAALYWGHPLRHVATSKNDPQDLGLHFRVNVEVF